VVVNEDAPAIRQLEQLVLFHDHRQDLGPSHEMTSETLGNGTRITPIESGLCRTTPLTQRWNPPLAPPHDPVNQGELKPSGR
jgi:hypothetical protein